MAKIRKAQSGAPVYKSPFGKKSADSTNYFRGKIKDLKSAQNELSKWSSISETPKGKNLLRDYINEEGKTYRDLDRQERKGKPGFDKDGNPISYKEAMKKGQAGLKASNKRVGPVDPKGAFTKVQKNTLAGKRTPVSLTRDKQLGATSMTAKKGIKVKAKGGKWIQSAIKKPGALRKSLGAKPGKPIPAGKLAKAAKAPGKMGQRARLAITLKKMKKK